MKSTISSRVAGLICRAATAACLAILAPIALAQVHTVPANPNVVLVNHDIISGNSTTLKAAADESLIGEDWEWNPGDGSGACNGSATSDIIDPNPASNFTLDDVGFYPYWAIWCEHTYTGNIGEVFISTVTVDTDGSSGGPYTAQYRAEIRPDTLPVEVNAAIDEALWHMHRNQFRFDGTEIGGTGGAIPMGRWDYPQVNGQAEVTVSGASVNAFEANGYLENGPATSPYSDTVARGLKYLISKLATRAITPQPAGDPDTNGNGLGIGVLGTSHAAIDNHATYKMGMVMDGIIASQNPAMIATTGPAGVINRTYGDIIQDMADYYYWSQGDDIGVQRGGWDYGPNATGGAIFSGLDNSSAGWAAIGLIAAEDQFGATMPPWVKPENEFALEATDTESDVSTTDGQHGYRSVSPLWGPYAVTGAAQVQMALDDIEATTSATPDERWIRAENFMRRGFNSTGGSNFKNYYYAMFNFAKAMREAHPAPVVVIGTEVGAAEGGVGCGPSAACAANGPQPLDWYNHPVDGLARYITDLQVASGVNIGQFGGLTGGSGSQDDHDTPWATQILTRALFQASPVARASASPNPGAENSPITFDPSDSFHQDPTKNIVLYEWDFDNDGTFDTSTPGPTNVMNSFVCPPPGVPCSFPVTLRVTDDNAPALTSDDIVIVEITIPPHPPTAVAGGPYLVCSAGEQLVLDGSGSFDVDEGESETHNPPFDTITAWEWDLDLASGAPFDFIDAVGATPAVAAPAPGVADIGLRVTDNTALAFPTSGQPDLTDTDSTTVTSGDCGCIGPLTIRPKSGQNQLVWTPVAGASSYDVARSTVGPNSNYVDIVTGHTTNYATYLDKGLTNGTTYWYRVTPVDAQGAEICDFSAAAEGTPRARVRR